MANDVRFNVLDYVVDLGGRMGHAFGESNEKIQWFGRINCMGKDENGDAYRIVAHFLIDDSPVPEPRVEDGNGYKEVDLFLPRDLLGPWTQMVRSDRPLEGFINFDNLRQSYISTRVDVV